MSDDNKMPPSVSLGVVNGQHFVHVYEDGERKKLGPFSTAAQAADVAARESKRLGLGR
ncbi:MAG: hypothetical protein P0Y65_05730 [Candidatus Devosia phytovorans]|uniref:Uncharacterized protein n=1 Tax=Candidatus Devosia phytovorans TaxID=3121372 RepID=A0AAJ5VX08_9HYPH|nr:hypothetical protein [Devosia sp.]WEK05755.1 MAG: hypothetical protein P0Y65_05730 [Devosia sp.]